MFNQLQIATTVEAEKTSSYVDEFEEAQQIFLVLACWKNIVTTLYACVDRVKRKAIKNIIQYIVYNIIICSVGIEMQNVRKQTFFH